MLIVWPYGGWLNEAIKQKHTAAKAKERKDTMNKKLIVLLASTAVLATAITAAACASKAVAARKAAAPVAPNATTAVQTTTTTTAEIINDGQNPAMNFIGNYYGGRACITVEPEGTNGANITVVWGSSYNTKAVWTMSGTFDEEATSIVYYNGYKKMITLNEKGDIISEEILLTDCKGIFVFSYDGVTWDDFEEHIADGMVFKYGSSVEDVCTTIFPGEIVETVPEATARPTEKPAPTATPVPTTAPTATPTPAPDPEPEVTEPTAEITEPAHKTAAEISGEYASGRATVTVDAADPDNVMIKVVWSESADTKVVWRITGKYNEDTESILYTNAVKKVITYAADGEAEYEEVCYTDGNGVILFSYNGFTWDDYNENIAENMVFIKQK